MRQLTCLRQCKHLRAQTRDRHTRKLRTVLFGYATFEYSSPGLEQDRFIHGNDYAGVLRKPAASVFYCEYLCSRTFPTVHDDNRELTRTAAASAVSKIKLSNECFLSERAFTPQGLKRGSS
ncbi:hypothetical protein BaRGS_00022848 [Batillaria attramentaria]|uniref:Uncharacterized protein n=1 Tax=Batillaria attramentaria TaxID=370345 RepID=A0ABD0KFP9_9CAEN